MSTDWVQYDIKKSKTDIDLLWDVYIQIFRYSNYFNRDLAEKNWHLSYKALEVD